MTSPPSESRLERNRSKAASGSRTSSMPVLSLTKYRRDINDSPTRIYPLMAQPLVPQTMGAVTQPSAELAGPTVRSIPPVAAFGLIVNSRTAWARAEEWLAPIRPIPHPNVSGTSWSTNQFSSKSIPKNWTREISMYAGSSSKPSWLPGTIPPSSTQPESIPVSKTTVRGVPSSGSTAESSDHTSIRKLDSSLNSVSSSCPNGVDARRVKTVVAAAADIQTMSDKNRISTNGGSRK